MSDRSSKTTAAAGGNGGEEKRRPIVDWFARWTFSILVVAAVAGGAWVGWMVAVPDRLPGVALKSVAIYRIEIAAAAFAALYALSVLVVMAFHNRGLSQIGKDGIRFQDMANRAQQQAIRDQRKQIATLVARADALEEVVFAMQNERKQANERLDEMPTPSGRVRARLRAALN